MGVAGQSCVDLHNISASSGIFCVRCLVWRKAVFGTHHCRVCQRCVEAFHHHCDVLGCCIGGHCWKGNLSFFMMLCGLALTGPTTCFIQALQALVEFSVDVLQLDTAPMITLWVTV